MTDYIWLGLRSQAVGFRVGEEVWDGSRSYGRVGLGCRSRARRGRRRVTAIAQGSETMINPSGLAEPAGGVGTKIVGSRVIDQICVQRKLLLRNIPTSTQAEYGR